MQLMEVVSTNALVQKVVHLDDKNTDERREQDLYTGEQQYNHQKYK
jgi:hypothetical protein